MSNQSVNIMLFMQLNTLVSTIKMNNFFVLKWNTLHQGNKGQALKFKLKKNNNWETVFRVFNLHILYTTF